MNYKKIYKNIVSKAKKEERKKCKDHYFEKHHIIPEFMFKNRKRKGPSGHLSGNPDDRENLVLLTAREHFLCHVLLYKIYQNSKYGYSTGSALQFFFSKVINNHPRSKHVILNGKKYEKYRKIGLESISKKMKGKFPAKDAITNESVGSVRNDHPNVLSGKWVHVTKDRKVPQSEIDKRPTQGSKNPNYKEMTDERRARVFEVVKRSIIENDFAATIFTQELKKEFSQDFKKISNVWIINNFQSLSNLVNEYNLRFNKDVTYQKVSHKITKRTKSVKNNKSA